MFASGVPGKILYIYCVSNTAVVVACVTFIPGFSPCRGY